MKISMLVKLIAKLEGKKSQVSIGNIREIVGIISDILALEMLAEIPMKQTVFYSLLVNGDKRAKKRKLKCKKSKPNLK